MGYECELLKGNTDSLLLCLISPSPMYGYQIIKKLQERSKGYFQFKEGTIYPALHRLEKAGLIIGTWQHLPGGMERRYYSMTEKGRAAFTERVAVWKHFSAAMNAVINPA
jgi:PadR family transcriptional regulator PadR